MWLTFRQKKKKRQFNPTNENPSCINILVTCMSLALMESVREHFLFSMQKLLLILKLVFSKIHVTLVMQYL